MAMPEPEDMSESREALRKLFKQPDPYGYELSLDLHGCDRATFTRDNIRMWLVALCEAIKMKREDLHFWDDYGLPEDQRQTSAHTKGTSAVQFILTSSIVIHTLDLLDAAYVNIFSCKVFDPELAASITSEAFGATTAVSYFRERV